MKMQWFEDAWNDYLWWQTIDKQILKKINQLLKDIQRNGNTGLGKPEPLKGHESGYWSRRIDDKQRLVYSIEGDIIKIISCKGHYDDK